MEADPMDQSIPLEETRKGAVSYQLEADLYRHLSVCEKNPGHQKFIAVNQLKIEHFPPSCQDNDLMKLVQAMADITARVDVKYVSDGRPETFLGTGMAYPFYRDRGFSDQTRQGVGWIYKVNIFKNTGSEFSDNSENKTCYCNDCLSSSKQNYNFAEIKIITRMHVVYDELEAAETTCYLFFHSGSTPASCSGVVTLSGMSAMEGEFVSDNCQMTYVTHDLDLADKLDKMVTHCKDLMKLVSIKYPTPAVKKLKSPPPPDSGPDIWHALTIIVSHPHGCSAQVCFGVCGHIHTTEDGFTSYTYTTPTCPGSSGSLVFIMGRYSWKDWKQMNKHSGNWQYKNYNYSGCYFPPI